MPDMDLQIPLHHTGRDAVIASNSSGKPSRSKKFAFHCVVLVALGMIVGTLGCLTPDLTSVEAEGSRRLFGHALGLGPLTPVSGASSSVQLQTPLAELAKLEEENARLKSGLMHMQSQIDQMEFLHKFGQERSESQHGNAKDLNGWNLAAGFGGLAILALGIRNGLSLVSGLGVTQPLHGRVERCAVQMSVAAPTPAMVDKELESFTLSNAAGDSTKIYKFGACVTSYIKGGTDYLMIRPDAKMDGSKPISGGIPHCFPQFGPGALQQHGFARNLDWDVVEKTDDKIVLGLSESEYTLAMWPYKFSALYTVTLAADCLKTELKVTNTDEKQFDFTAALHSYWSVTGIDNVKVTSPAFATTSYLDKMADPPKDVKSTSDTISISKETDSVYAGVAGDVVLADSGRKAPLTISNTSGWSDTVVWNPYGSEAMGFNNFICVESAKAASSVALAPKESWTGAMNVVP